MAIKLPFNYDLIKADYEVNDNDDDEMAILKTAIDKLKPVEKKIFLTYVELGSYAATARQFNVTAPTAKTYINNIKEKILTIL